MPTPDELEDAAAAESVRGLKARLEELTLRAMSLFDVLNEETRPTMAALIATQLAAIPTDDIADPMRRAAMEAARLGASDAARKARVSPPATVMAPTSVMLAVVQAPDKAREELEKAAEKVRVATTPDDLQDALTAARRAVSRTEAAARFSVNRSLSEGTKVVADAHGLSRIWLPERDACVHCLAYAGEIAGPGESFRGGLTFGAKAMHPTGAKVDCPLHPNCRCRVTVYVVGVDSPDLAASLKREALRSILRGWSLPSERPSVRLQAAERALRQATSMPKSVQDYARKAVRKGEFPRGRAFPAAVAPSARGSEPKKLKRVAPSATTSDVLALPKIVPERTYNVSQFGEADRIRDQIKPVNPNYEKGREWQVNCQRSTIAYELRARGYDVTAKPNHKGTDKQYSTPELIGLLGREAAYVLPTGTTTEDPDAPGAIRNPKAGEQREGTTLTSDIAAGAAAIASSWPPGARGWVIVAWKVGGAHIYNVEVDALGNVHWIDAQINKDMYRPEEHLDDVLGARIIRVDDLAVTEETVELVNPRTS